MPVTIKEKQAESQDNRGERDEEKIVKYHPRNSISSFTLLLFIIISIATAYDKISWNRKAIDLNELRNNKTLTASELNEALDNDFEYAGSTKTTVENVDVGGKNRRRKSTSTKSKINSITNDYDRKILSIISDGEHYFNRGHYPECISHFEKMLKKYPRSPRAMFGQAKCLDKLSETMRSNELLSKAIDAYGYVANQPHITNELLKQAMMRQAERMVFFGKTRDAIATLAKLTEKLPNDIEVLNKLGTSYLIMGSNRKAFDIHMKVIEMDSGNGIANANIGYVLKTSHKFDQAIPYLERGLESGDEETNDAKFYVFLGEAYTRAGRIDDAWKMYNQASEKGLFPSAAQRSTENAESRLRAQPWWDIKETGYEKEIRKLEYFWRTIREEALDLLKKNKDRFPPENEGLLHTGDWRQFTLYQRGMKMKKNCDMVPKTCELLDQVPDAVLNTRGQIKFSLMTAGTHVWPHTGPTNCRLRAHLGLIIPNGVEIRVGSEKRTWEHGKMLMFDDSFDHEVWHYGKEPRLVLIIDFWHPDLPLWERQSLSPI